MVLKANYSYVNSLHLKVIKVNLSYTAYIFLDKIYCILGQFYLMSFLSKLS